MFSNPTLRPFETRLVFSNELASMADCVSSSHARRMLQVLYSARLQWNKYFGLAYDGTNPINSTDNPTLSSRAINNGQEG
jgi:hypothetical protein